MSRSSSSASSRASSRSSPERWPQGGSSRSVRRDDAPALAHPPVALRWTPQLRQGGRARGRTRRCGLELCARRGLGVARRARPRARAAGQRRPPDGGVEAAGPVHRRAGQPGRRQGVHARHARRQRVVRDGAPDRALPALRRGREAARDAARLRRLARAGQRPREGRRERSLTVRNLGNQFKTAEGSVLYGVEHLATSVLLILGHSGCGAVKAAMAPHADLDGPIKAEIDGIVVPTRKPGANDADALTEAVLANVHDQVRAATARFADRVREGRLVIVGAVYDFRNDLKQGYGRVTVVNVNGTSDPAAITAFTKAVEK
ncbi:MAG: carbonic anhydrase [Myxococcales bacterium]|nr:carbonic anhydrase [Myxococcales bacterium]